MNTPTKTAKKGFIPVMLTPFDQDGKIDFDGLAQLTEYYIQSGAIGLFANCQSSEMFDLSPIERLQVTEQVIKTSGGRVPVVAAGNFGNTIAEQADFIKQIYALGLQAVILLTNQLVKQDEPEAIFEANFNQLLSLTDNIPVGFYECPVPYKIVLSPALVGRMVKTGRVTYYKDTCLDLAQVKEKNEQCKDASEFGLYDAYMAHAVDSLKSGSAGLSCIQGNYFPELVVWLCNHYNEAEVRAEVAMVQQFFIDEMDVMHNNYPASAKYFLQKRGLNMSTYVRKLKSDNIIPEVKQEMDELYARYQELLKNIPSVAKDGVVV